LLRSITRGYSILLYHSVGETSWNYDIKLSDFKSHLDYLKANCSVLPIPSIVERLKSQKCDGFYCGITFDDGYKNNCQAFHILRKHDLSATIFLATDYVGARFGSREMLTWKEIKELHLSGLITFGSHAQTHRDLTCVNAEEIRDELSTSKRILEEKLDSDVEFLSIPAGRTNKLVEDIAKDVGYSAMFSSEPKINHPKKDIFEIGRICIYNSTSNLSSFILKLYGLRDKIAKIKNKVF